MPDPLVLGVKVSVVVPEVQNEVEPAASEPAAGVPEHAVFNG
jgi:hypothetical protein